MRGKTRRILSLLLSFGLLFQQISFAQVAAELNLGNYLSRIGSNIVQERFRPLRLRYFSYDSLNDNFKVLLDKGDLKNLQTQELENSTKTLLGYFLIGVTLPDEMFWVNLRPDSEDQIIDPWLEKTDVGKIMLEADLQLKKDTAAMTSPATPQGREYWDKLYKKVEEIYGYDAVTIPTLTRPWIIPGEIIVRESKDSAYVYKATLKVMLEQDYLKDSATYNFKDERSKALNEYSSQLIRELIIPKLTKEVNSSKRYAPLRQVYYSLILSRWFKLRFTGKTGTYASLINSRNLTNLTSQEPWTKTTYFKQYQKSFQDGEYNIKEPVYTPTGQIIRSYFSGGINVASSAINTQNGIILSNDNANKLGDVIGGKAVIDPRNISLKPTIASSPITITKEEIDNESDWRMKETERAVNERAVEGVPKKNRMIFNYDLRGVLRKKVVRIIKMLNIGRGGKPPAGVKEPKMVIPFGEGRNFLVQRPETPIKENVDIGGISTDITINPFPLLKGHILLIPERKEGKHNQVFIDKAAIVAFAHLRNMNRSSYKVAFNSMAAFGSFNHLHLQAFDYVDDYTNPGTEIPSSLPVENEIPTELFPPRNGVTISTLPNWMVGTIVLSSKDSNALQKDILNLTDILYKLEQPFNILFSYNPADEMYKVYVFPRKPETSSKFGTGVAYLELSGEVLFINQNFGGVVLTAKYKNELDKQLSLLRDMLRTIDPKQKYEWYETEENTGYKYYIWPSKSGQEGKVDVLDTKYMAYAPLSEKKIDDLFTINDISKRKATYEKYLQDSREYVQKSREIYENVNEQNLEAEIAAVGIDKVSFDNIVGQFRTATASSAVNINVEMYKEQLRPILQDENEYKNVLDEIKRLDKEGKLSQIFPVMEVLKEKPKYVTKVFEHTLRVIEELELIKKGDMDGFNSRIEEWRKDWPKNWTFTWKFEGKEGENLFNKYRLIFQDLTRTPEDRELLYLIALLHDVGEQVKTQGHPNESARMIEPWLEQIGFSQEKINKVKSVLRSHVDLGTLYFAERTPDYLSSNPGSLNIDLKSQKGQEYIKMLSLLTFVDTGEAIVGEKAEFYAEVGNNPKYLDELKNNFYERRQKLFSSKADEKIDNDKYLKVNEELKKLEKLLTKEEMEKFVKAINSGIEVIDYCIFFCRGLKGDSLVKILFIMHKLIEGKDIKRVNLTAPSGMAPTVAAMIDKNILENWDLKEISSLSPNNLEKKLEEKGLKIKYKEGQLFIFNREYYEDLGLLFDQFLSPDTNVKTIAKGAASKLSLEQLRQLMQLLRDKYNATRDKSPLEENQDYYGLGLEDPIVAAAAKEALEYLERLKRNLGDERPDSSAAKELYLEKYRSLLQMSKDYKVLSNTHLEFVSSGWLDVGLRIYEEDLPGLSRSINSVLDEVKAESSLDRIRDLIVHRVPEGKIEAEITQLDKDGFKNVFRAINSIVEEIEAAVNKPSSRAYIRDLIAILEGLTNLKVIVGEYIYYEGDWRLYPFKHTIKDNRHDCTEQLRARAERALNHITQLLEQQKVDISAGSPAQTSKTSSSSVDTGKGGIDFRALPMTIQPMGTFNGLNFQLPQLSQAELERINVDSEMQRIKNMVQSGIIPSGERIKELIAACIQKKEMDTQVDNLLLGLADIFKLEEENACESSPELKEALVIVDSQT